jgi:hypothetical protein
MFTVCRLTDAARATTVIFSSIAILNTQQLRDLAILFLLASRSILLVILLDQVNLLLLLRRPFAVNLRFLKYFLGALFLHIRLQPKRPAHVLQLSPLAVMHEL